MHIFLLFSRQTISLFEPKYILYTQVYRMALSLVDCFLNTLNFAVHFNFINAIIVPSYF